MFFKLAVINKLKTFLKNLMANLNIKDDSIPLNNLTFSLEDLDNGLCFKEHYIPEEVVVYILSFVNPKELLTLGLVCRRWYNITRSYQLWSMIYENKYKKKPKKLPWYVFYCRLATNYFDTNLIKNGNGEEGLEHWTKTKNEIHQFIVEPQLAGPTYLPLDAPECNGHTSCFVTTFFECRKHQIIKLKNKLFLYILDRYKPHLYASEWVLGRFDSGSVYEMTVKLLSEANEILGEQFRSYIFDWSAEREWTKVEAVITEYHDDVRSIIFEHGYDDRQTWPSYYGNKMAGVMVKFIFDSIQETGEDKEETTEPNT